MTAKAAERLRSAGLAAAGREDYDAAMSLLARANEILPREAPERAELLPRLAEMLLWVGGADAARSLLEEAYALANELGDRRLAARARLTAHLTLMWTDTPIPPKQMLREVDEAVPVLEDAGDEEGLAMAELVRFHALDQARLPGPEERLPVALDHARRAHAPQIEHRVMSWICITLPARKRARGRGNRARRGDPSHLVLGVRPRLGKRRGRPSPRGTGRVRGGSRTCLEDAPRAA